jgi:hypothetical protein
LVKSPGTSQRAAVSTMPGPRKMAIQSLAICHIQTASISALTARGPTTIIASSTIALTTHVAREIWPQTRSARESKIKMKALSTALPAASLILIPAKRGTGTCHLRSFASPCCSAPHTAMADAPLTFLSQSPRKHHPRRSSVLQDESKKSVKFVIFE